MRFLDYIFGCDCLESDRLLSAAIERNREAKNSIVHKAHRAARPPGTPDPFIDFNSVIERRRHARS